MIALRVLLSPLWLALGRLVFSETSHKVFVWFWITLGCDGGATVEEMLIVES